MLFFSGVVISMSERGLFVLESIISPLMQRIGLTQIKGSLYMHEPNVMIMNRHIMLIIMRVFIAVLF